MPIINRIGNFASDMTGWRRHLHMHPELEFDCFETAGFVVERLKEFGVDEIHEGIAKTGIVAIINGKDGGNGTTLGLRADMDALPMQETTGLEYQSVHEGKMHACGHDGHTTMLLGAARYLAETRNFAGKVALIFQPAEENGGGAGVMVEEGILDRFGITEVYAVHTSTEAEVGHFYTVPSAIMAACDSFEITVTGTGGHAAYPHETADPLAAIAGIYSAIQTIVSRNLDPLAMAVVSVTQIHGGTAENIIPGSASMGGTIRTLDKDVRALIFNRLDEIAESQSGAYGCKAKVNIIIGYPATINDPAKTEFAIAVAQEISGENSVDANRGLELGAEDFAFMLEARPGSYLNIGQGAGPGVHNSSFDFNDEILPIGASYFARLVERAQPTPII